MKNTKKPVEVICAVVSVTLVLFALAGLAHSKKRSFR